MGDSIIDFEEIKSLDDMNCLKIEEFFIFQDGTIYKLVISELENEISIKYKKYEIVLDMDEITSLFKIRINSIDSIYKYISKFFENNKVLIKSIDLNKSIKLSFCLNDINSNDIEIELKYDENLNSSTYEELINKYNKLQKNIKEVKQELNNLKKEQKNIKIIQNSDNPKEIQFSSDIASDSFAGFSYDDSFTVFRSINNILQLIYATKNKSIVCYDLDKMSIVHKEFNSHNNYITNFRHFLDQANRRDIIMSISKKDNNVKLWDATTWENICNITNVNAKDFLYSACFLKENNQNYIITSNGCNRQFYMDIHNFEPLKIYNFNGEKIKEFNESNDCTFFIDTYYDNKLSKNFIITGNYNYIKSYDYYKNEVYHKYFENNNGIHPSVIIKKNEEKIKLIESCEDGLIRIWGFHSGSLLRKIKTDNDNLYGVCLWNDNYAFVGCKDQTIKLIELKNGLLIKTIKGHKGRIISFKKIIEPNKGNFLFSQGLDQKIKLWIYKENLLN